jgi:uncharacterized membrane protein
MFRSLVTRVIGPVVVTARVTRPRQEVFAYYRALWQQCAGYVSAAGPFTAVIEERHGEWIAWRSRSGAGRVTFTAAPGPAATDVKVSLEAGLLARMIVRRAARADLRRFAQAIAIVPRAASPTATAPECAPRRRPSAFQRR